jgi:phospholipase C
VIVNQSNTPLATLTNGSCGTAAAGAPEARCGHGPRIPVLAISPCAKVDSAYSQPVASQASILRFIADNGRLGGGSFDAMTGSLDGMFNFSHPAAAPPFLDPSTGEATHR